MIGVIDILILIPLALSAVDDVRSLWLGENIVVPEDIARRMGVILIGWGVVLEERSSIRGIFGLVGGGDESRQVALDHCCHSTGLGLLIFGLFAEMCIGVIRMPNYIIDTQGINRPILCLSIMFLVISAYVLVRHIGALAITQFSPAPDVSHSKADD
jgi:hypothetical protein